MSRPAPTSHLHVQPVALPRKTGLHPVKQGRVAGLQPSAATRAPQRKQGRAHADLPVTNAASTRRYDGAELRAHVRPGALVAFTLPSRINNRLHHPDGRVTCLQAKPITNQP